MIAINTLKLTKLAFTLTFAQDTHLPQFIGNTIRGALGQALYTHHPHAFNHVFKVGAAKSIPNPIAISAPYPSQTQYRTGDTLTFFVTLMGTACAFEQTIIDAAQLMCNGRLASATLTNCLQVYSLTWSDMGAAHIPPCNKLSIHFLTPTEILASGKFHNQLDFSTFIDRVFLRICNVIDTYGESEFTLPYNLVIDKPHVHTTCQLQVVKFQTNNQPITGFLGTVQFEGDLTRYLPYIDLASQIHIGKKTTRGCGQFSFEI